MPKSGIGLALNSTKIAKKCAKRIQLKMEDITLKHRIKELNLWDKFMMAITFAEAGEAETAIQLFDQKTKEKRPETRARKSEKRPELRV
jgi:hypothetical protein